VGLRFKTNFCYRGQTEAVTITRTIGANNRPASGVLVRKSLFHLNSHLYAPRNTPFQGST